MSTTTEIARSGARAWAAVATATPKAVGQDRSAVLFGPPGGTAGTGLVICDGVGQFDGSGDVASRCVAHVEEYVREQGFGTGMLTCARAVAERMGHGEPAGATTLIAVAIDEEGFAFWTLVGNGSLFELEAFDIRGSCAEFGLAELALPHISYGEGRPALRSTLPADPRMLEVSGGMLLPRAGRTRAFLACSDGIATNEDWQQGQARDGSTLLRIPEPLVVVLDHLSRGWVAVCESAAPDEQLQALLDAALAELLRADALEDDATAGLLFVRDESR